MIFDSLFYCLRSYHMFLVIFLKLFFKFCWFIHQRFFPSASLLILSSPFFSSLVLCYLPHPYNFVCVCEWVSEQASAAHVCLCVCVRVCRCAYVHACVCDPHSGRGITSQGLTLSCTSLHQQCGTNPVRLAVETSAFFIFLFSYLNDLF